MTSIVGGKREYIKVPRLLVPYEIADVIALRDADCIFARYTNIPWVFNERHPESDFEWGYHGQGPWDFSVNILMHFTNHDAEFSEKYAALFREKFVSQIPRPGGRLKKEDILDFIQEKKKCGA